MLNDDTCILCGKLLTKVSSGCKQKFEFFAPVIINVSGYLCKLVFNICKPYRTKICSLKIHYWRVVEDDISWCNMWNKSLMTLALSNSYSFGTLSNLMPKI